MRAAYLRLAAITLATLILFSFLSSERGFSTIGLIAGLAEINGTLSKLTYSQSHCNCTGWVISKVAGTRRSTGRQPPGMLFRDPTRPVCFDLMVRDRLSEAKVCIGCSVDAHLKIGDGDNPALVFNNYSPALTNGDGHITVCFSIGQLGLPKNTRTNGAFAPVALWAVVAGTGGVAKAVVHPHTCLWRLELGREVNWLTHNETWSCWCSENEMQLVTEETIDLVNSRGDDNSTAKTENETLCSQYTGRGMWHQHRFKDHYVWKEDGCTTLNQSYMQAAWANSTGSSPRRIAFVGDSVLRNLYYEWSNWHEGTPKWYSDFPYQWHDTRMSTRYFETYGYYPIQTFTGAHDPRCCGESDCVRRQTARKGRLGFNALRAALEWLDDGGVLIVRSPVIHQARAYVSDVQHRDILVQILSMLRPRLEHSKDAVTIWMSATPLQDTHLKEVWMENNSARRYRLYQIEQGLLANLSLSSQLLRMEVWNMAHGRRDNYFDDTHVYPASFYSTPPDAFPRTIPKTWVAWLNTMMTVHCD